MLHSAFVCEFDGTITLTDSTDLLLSRFADPAGLDIEKEWLAGQIGSRECLERQLYGRMKKI